MIPVDDARQVVRRHADLWDALRGCTVLMTGATGFFGRWLVGTLWAAAKEHDLGVHLVVLSRRPDEARTLLGPAPPGSRLEIVEGDVREPIRWAGSASYLFHAATDASARLNREDPGLMLSTIYLGTERALEWARRSGVSRTLLASSGAVYGPSSDPEGIDESCMTGPDPLGSLSAYGEGKRVAEQLCAIAARTGAVPSVAIARCFAFVGPHLPLDAHFAIGNFIRDGLLGRDIAVHGDGSAVRSYLYASDLAEWLWTILLKAPSLRPYNVGSSRGLSILRIAQLVASRFPHRPEVKVSGSSRPAPRDVYLPRVDRAKVELGLEERVQLEDAIDRTIAWYRQHQSHWASGGD